MVGMVTALHGVADCKMISAVADDGVIFTDLVIAAVDIDHDMALLTSPDLADLPTDGLAVSTLSSTEILTAPLRIVGYPLGLDKQDVDSIESVRDIESLDGVIPDTEESTEFLKRKSPDIDVDVLNLQAQLLPGHSGAPLIDEAGQLVAVGNGGLRGGTVGRSWAMPWQLIELESITVAAVNKKLAELATKDITALSFSSTYPGALHNTESATYMVQVVDMNQQPIANAEILLTHSAGYEIGMTDSHGFHTFHLSTNSSIDYTQSQIQVEAAGYKSYSSDLPNEFARVSPNKLLLTALSPTATMPPTNTPSATASPLCSFAFLVLNSESEEPIRRATIAVFVGVKQDTGVTDSTGYYLVKLPCSNEQDVEARVRVSADGYTVYNRSVFLSNETTEILLERKVTTTPTPEAPATFTPILTVTPQTTDAAILMPSESESSSQEITELVIGVDRCNVRSGPGTNYPILGTANSGERLITSKINSDNTWWQIKYNGELGWVARICVNALISATPIPATAIIPDNSPMYLQYDGIDASHEATEARNAFDRNTTTLWAPYNKSIGMWVEVRFRSPKIVSRVGIYRDPLRTLGGQITEFTLTFSDGSRQMAKLQGLNEWEYVDIQPVETTSIKLEVESVYPTSNGVFVYEIELLGYDSPSTGQFTEMLPVTETLQIATAPSSSPFRLQYDGIKVSDEYAGSPAINAFDRKLDTHWSNYDKAAGVWMELLFRNPKTVSQIRIYRGPEMFSWGQIQQASLIFSDGSRQSINLQGFDGWEQVDIRPVLTTSLKLEIDSVHSGTNKLLVYEIEIWGTE